MEIGVKNIVWTLHAKAKMQYYGLSESRVRRVLRQPRRVEEGVAEETVALMQPTSIKRRRQALRQAQGLMETWTQEIWVMAKKQGRGLKIISVWRYPGVAPQRNPIPIEILREADAEGLL